MSGYPEYQAAVIIWLVVSCLIMFCICLICGSGYRAIKKALQQEVPPTKYISNWMRFALVSLVIVQYGFTIIIMAIAGYRTTPSGLSGVQFGLQLCAVYTVFPTNLLIFAAIAVLLYKDRKLRVAAEKNRDNGYSNNG